MLQLIRGQHGLGVHSSHHKLQRSQVILLYQRPARTHNAVESHADTIDLTRLRNAVNTQGKAMRTYLNMTGLSTVAALPPPPSKLASCLRILKRCSHGDWFSMWMADAFMWASYDRYSRADSRRLNLCTESSRTQAKSQLMQPFVM